VVELLIGAALAALTVALARLSGFDRERAFFPMLLMVIATYYVLFAAMSPSSPPLLPEAGWAAMFMAVAIAGYKRSLWLAVAGLLVHGLFDAVHGFLIENLGMPSFWPAFCAAYDLVLAGYLASLLRRTAGQALREPARDSLIA
jgi:hypothetical protein